MRNLIQLYLSATVPAKIFCGMTVAIFPIMFYLALHGGINGDERFHVPQAEASIDWYTSFGKDKSFMIPKKEGGAMVGKTTYFYGGLVDITSGIINRCLGFETNDLRYHDVRHLVIAFIGSLGIVFAGFLANMLLGYEAGILTMLLLFATPRFTGHALFNPKDLPFAVGYIMSVFFIIKYVLEIPKINKYTTLGLISTIAFAINVRVGGILLIAYLFLFTATTIFIRYKKLGKNFKFGRYVKIAQKTAIVGIFGYLGGMLLWPYGLMNPITNPLKALSGFTNFHTSMNMLFSGDYIAGSQVPWNYIPEWILVTTPTIILLGFLFGLYHLYQVRKEWKKYLPLYILLFSIFFPIVYVIYKNSVLYDGLRHLLFVLPFIVIFSSLGYSYVANRISNRKYKLLFYSFIFLGIMNPILYTFANPAVAYTFFNPLVGGIEGAQTKYSTDYYMLGAREACDKLINGIVANDNKIVVGTDCVYPVRIYLNNLAPEIKTAYTSINSRYRKDWNYGLYFSRFLHPEIIKNGGWPLDLSFDQVKVRGACLYSIVRKVNTDDFKGIQLLNKNKVNEAIPLLEKSVLEQPNNHLLLRELGRAYMSLNQFAKSEDILSKSLAVHPDDYVALNYLGITKLNQGQNDQASNTFKRSIKAFAPNHLGYYYLAVLEERNKNYNGAASNLQNCLGYQPNYKPALQLLATVYDKTGNAQKAQQIRARIK